jgi:hypothetical protein
MNDMENNNVSVGLVDGVSFWSALDPRQNKWLPWAATVLILVCLIVDIVTNRKEKLYIRGLIVGSFLFTFYFFQSKDGKVSKINLG